MDKLHQNLLTHIHDCLGDAKDSASRLAVALGQTQHPADAQTMQAGDSSDSILGAKAQAQAKAFAPAPKFVLGASSQAKLDGVIPYLAATVRLAITLTTQDFTVYEGLRSPAQQKINVAKGVSKTLDSKHIRQSDGFGHAVDLVPWMDGHPVWDWNGCYVIAMAMDRAATQLGFAHSITWGAVWDRTLADMDGDAGAYEKAVDIYRMRHAGVDFLDGPHFEWKA